MIELSTKSLFFAAFLILSPFVLRTSSGIRKKYIFLLINIVIYICSMGSALQLAVASVWLICPYLYVRFLPSKTVSKTRPFFFALMVVIFVYLMKYDAVWNFLHIPYIFTFKLLGLSYFLFRQIDFIMQYDLFEEDGIPVSFGDYLNYILSFYTLLAGPILRYAEFVTDFYEEKTALTRDEIYNALNRAINGYLKVYLLSGIAGHFAKSFFDGLFDHGSILKAAAAFCIFAFFNGWYIYLNFSGYCDIVIAFASLAGLKVHENFNRPYLARSVTEFWNRHHITLSEWIRDYIYSPLFKSFISGPFKKHVKAGQYLALFLTFTIAGIWHGTDLNYLIYGLFQGLGVVVATMLKDRRKKKYTKEQNKAWEASLAAATLGRCVTWGYICLTFSFVGYDVVGLVLK